MESRRSKEAMELTRQASGLSATKTLFDSNKAILGLMHIIGRAGDWQSAIHLFRAFLFDLYYHVKESEFQKKERWNPTSSPTSAKLPSPY
eukprot:scaffold22056_cov60-Cyclotella_meneghiniana.AAC.3